MPASLSPSRGAVLAGVWVTLDRWLWTLMLLMPPPPLLAMLSLRALLRERCCLSLAGSRVAAAQGLIRMRQRHELWDCLCAKS